jgi:hypothetical protein
MPRKRSFLGKNPGGRSRGIPGNPSNGMGWGGVFKKKGDWGILNPMEWAGFATKMRFGEVGPRPQGQLQEVIGYNLGLEKQIQQAAQERRQRRAEAQQQEQITIKQPGFDFLTGGGSGIPKSGGKKTGGGASGKSGSNAGGGTTAPAGGGKSGGSGTAKPTKLSASAKKALSNPVARGR